MSISTSVAAQPRIEQARIEQAPTEQAPTEQARTGDDRVAPGRAEANSERRDGEREITIFRPCCVESDERAQIGLIRNMSDRGALIESDLPVKKDDRIRYSWNNQAPIEARVAWRQGNRFGVQNLASAPSSRPLFPYRSVRVPCDMVGTAWIAGEPRECWVVNVSLTGAMLFGLDDLPVGKPLSLELAGHELDNATVRWCDNGSVGIRFAEPIAPSRLMRMLSEADAQIRSERRGGGPFAA